jgi:hypothetical protein
MLLAAVRHSAFRWDAQRLMIIWQILQVFAMLLHQALHEGLAIVPLAGGQALLLAYGIHAGSAVLVQAGLVTQLAFIAHLIVQPNSPTYWDWSLPRLLDMLAIH